MGWHLKCRDSAFFMTAGRESFLSEFLHSHKKLFALTSKYFVARKVEPDFCNFIT